MFEYFKLECQNNLYINLSEFRKTITVVKSNNCA